MKSVKQVVAVFAWCTAVIGWHSAFAEYQAITHFPRCELITGKKECVVDAEPADKEIVTNYGVDDTDIKACQAIAENINELEKYNIAWECGMPISANNYLLSKPQWVEVSGQEKKNALEALLRMSPNYKDMPADDKLFKEKTAGVDSALYAYPVDIVISAQGNEKIYTQTNVSNEFPCIPGYRTRNSFWFAGIDGSSVDMGVYNINPLNLDIVLYKGRVYFIGFEKLKGFYVMNLKHDDRKSGFSANINKPSNICKIIPLQLNNQ